MYLPYDTKDKNTTAGIPCAISTSTEFFGDKQQRGFSSSGGGGGGEILCDKSEQSLPLQNDVYAFIAVAPVMSTPFIFALYVVFVKYCVCGLLAFGISFENIGSSNPYDDIVKFLLIPVAIAMQEDLVHVSLSKLFICCVSKTLNVVGGCCCSCCCCCCYCCKIGYLSLKKKKLIMIFYFFFLTFVLPFII
jgi:hypothetical protein